MQPSGSIHSISPPPVGDLALTDRDREKTMGVLGAKKVERASDVTPELLGSVVPPVSLDDAKLKTIGKGNYGVVAMVGTINTLEVLPGVVPDEACALQSFYVVKKQRPMKREKEESFMERMKKEYELQSLSRHSPKIKEQKVLSKGKVLEHQALMEFAGAPLVKAMRYEGESIPLPVETVRDLSRQILEILKENHKKGIIHRDLKPENIMVDSSGKVSLVDYGASDQTEPESCEFKGRIGTPYFMTPQHFMNEKYSVKADVWAMGMIMVEMLVGERPRVFNHKGLKFIQFTFNQSKYDGFIKRLTESSNLSQEVKELLVNMLKVDETDRFSADKALKSAFFDVDELKMSVSELQYMHQKAFRKLTQLEKENEFSLMLGESVALLDDQRKEVKRLQYLINLKKVDEAISGKIEQYRLIQKGGSSDAKVKEAQAGIEFLTAKYQTIMEETKEIGPL